MLETLKAHRGCIWEEIPRHNYIIYFVVSQIGKTKATLNALALGSSNDE
jgi:hypothetical protein